MSNYTTIPLCEHESAINCNDCGAYVISNNLNKLTESDVKHHNSCKPTNPLFYDLTGSTKEWKRER